VVSDWSENLWVLRPVVSDRSGGVGIVCGMKRGITEVDLSHVQVQIGDPTWLATKGRRAEPPPTWLTSRAGTFVPCDGPMNEIERW